MLFGLLRMHIPIYLRKMPISGEQEILNDKTVDENFLKLYYHIQLWNLILSPQTLNLKINAHVVEPCSVLSLLVLRSGRWKTDLNKMCAVKLWLSSKTLILRSYIVVLCSAYIYTWPLFYNFIFTDIPQLM